MQRMDFLIALCVSNIECPTLLGVDSVNSQSLSASTTLTWWIVTYIKEIAVTVVVTTDDRQDNAKMTTTAETTAAIKGSEADKNIMMEALAELD